MSPPNTPPPRRGDRRGGQASDFVTVRQAIKFHASTTDRQWPVPPASWRQLTRAGHDVATLRIGSVVEVEPEVRRRDCCRRDCCESLARRLDVLEIRLREARDLVEVTP